MKNKFFISLSLCLIIVLSVAFVSVASSKLTLVVNGKVANTDPILYKDRTYVPVRAAAELLGAKVNWNQKTNTATVTTADVVTVVFPVEDYKATAAHITAAIKKGHSAVCTIDRKGADKNREESLKGIPTKAGYDRDEWPMAMCAEGGEGASVAYVIQSDNRGAGSWIGNKLDKYPDGTKVAFAILGLDTSNVDLFEVAKPSTNVVYNSCAEVKAAGAAPIYKGQPGYSTKLDRDGDGVACET